MNEQTYFGALILLTAAACIAVFAPRRGTRCTPDREPREPLIGLRGLLILGWAYSIVPAAIDVFSGTRGAVVVTVTHSATAQADTARTLIWLLFMALAGVIVLRNLKHRSSGAVVFLLPWVAIQISTMANGSLPPKSALLIPAIALAAAFTAPSVRTLETLGKLTIATAVLSLGIATLTPHGFLDVRPPIGQPTPLEEKALIGSQLLAGPYGHSNTLGMALALGLPFVLLIRPRWLKFAGVAVVASALVWTASRTSITTAAIVLMLTFAAMLLSSRAIARWGSIGIVAALVTMLYIPLSTLGDPTAYSQRGRIWIAIYQTWQESAWFGHGPYAFHAVSRATRVFGLYAFHGHNLFMHSLMTLGVFGVLAWAVFLIAAARRSVRIGRAGQPAFLYFLITFLTVSCLEISTDLTDLSQLGYVTIVPFAVLFYCRKTDELDTASGAEEAHKRTSPQMQPTHP
ncbi:O-antigen ligase family protein [Rhodococcus opacus]|uniref:O-antigen ligase family protein n=1 Tax=Rhodococcus opacus TaxID=37919 RepID=UPI000EA9741A|nr:O-antigen ligase family protein [Rhodococcus opacus]QZS54689.1 O-antigen ligase family protein [Rhodococcus opacus]RKM72231.1 hypothetical protein COO55_09300 [Rhodococcus opacus]